jgi:transposase-like protein
LEIKTKIEFGSQADSEVTSPRQLLNALKRYLDESGDTEQKVASQMGVNYHTLHRWLSDAPSPMKEELAQAACFLRRAKYL